MTANLGLPVMSAGQAQKHVTYNDAIYRLDGLTQLSVISTVVTAPPGSPAEGDRYIIPSGATGVWASNDDAVAIWYNGAWAIVPPKTGWLCYDEAGAEFLKFVGGSWVSTGF